jgi:hypothetical protein
MTIWILIKPRSGQDFEPFCRRRGIRVWNPIIASHAEA